MQQLKKFVKDQLSVWPLASANFRRMKSVERKQFDVFGLRCTVQCNPARAASTNADISPEAIASRKCFLCAANRPAEQMDMPFEGRKGRSYRIQINPYPILPGHLVVVRKEHLPQCIWHHLPDMLDFARKYQEYTVFYNGPESGASAPDHLHFQAVPRHMLPLENAVASFLDANPEPMTSVKDARLFRYDSYTRGTYVISAETSKSLAKLFYRLLDCVAYDQEGREPKFNLFAFYEKGEYRVFVTMRSAIRSHHYFSTGADHLTISPGAADMAGLFITPSPEDMQKVTGKMLEEILEEVSISAGEQEKIEWRLTRHQRKIDVGIMLAEEIRFEIISDGAGPQKVTWRDGRIDYNGALYDELYFDGITRSTVFAEPSFILYGVTIGIDFHWQRKRDLRYAGGLKFVVEGDKIRAINRVGLEHYLLSVISSEMKSSASLDLLKAHAVISRSWALARIEDSVPDGPNKSTGHVGFVVCADDHCQRYQGASMATGVNVRKAIDQTWGQVLRYDGQLCDTRYSKCCGGLTEIFSTCWEDIDYPYLKCVEDKFCDCENSSILTQVLNDYDVETGDFHDWTVRYTQDELSELVKRRSGTDFGTIQDLVPVQRGPSGRIKFLRIVGSLQTKVVGKELVIRRYLSESHLKSSAFTVRREGADFILDGKGWGHGVGLCQIGAAVMADEGYDYKQILNHYYPGAKVEE